MAATKTYNRHPNDLMGHAQVTNALQKGVTNASNMRALHQKEKANERNNASVLHLVGDHLRNPSVNSIIATTSTTGSALTEKRRMAYKMYKSILRMLNPYHMSPTPPFIFLASDDGDVSIYVRFEDGYYVLHPEMFPTFKNKTEVYNNYISRRSAKAQPLRVGEHGYQTVMVAIIKINMLSVAELAKDPAIENNIDEDFWEEENIEPNEYKARLREIVKTLQRILLAYQTMRDELNPTKPESPLNQSFGRKRKDVIEDELYSKYMEPVEKATPTQIAGKSRKLLTNPRTIKTKMTS
jgi:hypothetical protein